MFLLKLGIGYTNRKDSEEIINNPENSTFSLVCKYFYIFTPL